TLARPTAGPEAQWHNEIVIQPMFSPAYRVEVPKAEGGHSGGHPRLQEQLFAATPPADELGGMAGHGQGVASALIGIAANQAFVSGQPVRIADLCPHLGDAVKLHDLP